MLWEQNSETLVPCTAAADSTIALSAGSMRRFRRPVFRAGRAMGGAVSVLALFMTLDSVLTLCVHAKRLMDERATREPVTSVLLADGGPTT